MGRNTHAWEYGTARTSSHGEMICLSCGQAIEGDVEYRWRWNKDYTAWLTEHRTCCEDDPMWARIDDTTAKAVERLKRKLEAYKKFRDEWEESALDEEIEAMEESLKCR